MKRKLSLKFQGIPYEVAVALAYLLVAVLWIFFSDRTLAAWVHDPEQFITLSLYKGWFYVGITGVLLYVVLQRIFRHIRLAQKNLSESEARYRLLIENQTDLVVKMDLTGRYLFVSPSCCTLFGRPEDALLGMPFMTLVHEGDQASIKAAWDVLFKRPHKAYVEQRTVTREGLRWLAWQYTAMLDAEGSVESIVGVGRDITEKNQSEDTLRESEAKLVEAQHIAKIGRWDLDFVSNTLAWSDEIYDLLEISREEYSPAYETMLSFIHPDDRELLDQTFQKAREGKTTYELEHRLLMPDGRIKWVNELGKFEYDDLGAPFKGFGTAQDITERKLAEQALRESDGNFKAITNQSAFGITVADLDGLYTFVNPAFCEMVGYSNEELLRMSVFDVKAKDQDHSTFSKSKTSEEGLPIEVVLARKDGTEFVAEVVGKVVSINGEKCVLGIIRDITSRKLTEDALRESESKYRDLAENTSAILWEYNIEKDRWMYVAPQVERILGYAPEEWTNLDFWASHLHEEDRKWAVSYCGDCSARGESHDFEYRFLKKNGEIIWLRDVVDVEMKDGAAVILRGLMIDITERKKAEVELHQAQRQLEATLDAIPDLLFELGLDSHIYDYHSPRTDLLFVPPENFIGKKMSEVLSAEVSDVVMEALKEAHAQGRSSGKQYPLLLDQGIRWFEFSVSRKPESEGEGPRFIAISRDITERKQAEDELEKRDNLLRKSQGIAHVGSWELDTVNHVLSWSEETYRIFGVEPQEFNVSHEAFLEIVHPEDREKINTAYSNSLEDGSDGYEIEHRIVLQKTGEVRFVHEKCDHIRDHSGKVIRSVGMAQDITERKQAAEEKERLLAAINQASETVLITDAEGTIQYVNPAFEKVSGYSREEVMGKNPRVLKSSEQDDAFYRSMWKILAAGKTWSGRITNRKKDGTLYTEDATISPVKDDTGKIINYVAIKADITTELTWEKQYRQTQKLESVGRLAGGVAHDFNNILQTITGFCGLILAEMDTQSAQRQDVIEIQKAAQLAGELTQQLLAFSRKQPTEYKEMDLNEVLSEGKKMLQQVLGEKFQLQFKLDSHLAPVRADASQVLQVAMNLVVNARDAMQDGGTITLCTLKVEVTEKDLSDLPNTKAGKFVCFMVKDTGCGMDEKQLASIYEPFFTTKKLGKGTGLGLSVVYGIVEEHGGWIDVESEPENGTSFKICLPVHEVSVSGADDEVIPYDAFMGRRILLVEDDPVVRELTAEILQDVGYAVSVAADASEAKKLFSEKKETFDLLLSDVVLPDGNGIELADIFLKQCPELSILLFSGHSDECVQRDIITEKGFNYICKPFNLKKLLDTVELTITAQRAE